MPTPAELEDIAWAIGEISARRESYHLHRNYYAGAHRLMISATRLRDVFGNLFGRFRLNLCSAVVDALADRLEVASFSSAGEEDQDALAIWKRNRMMRRAGQVHQEAIAAGDAYVIVWPAPNGVPTLYPQKAHEIAVHYSSDEPGLILKAAKMWNADDDTTRLTLYYPDRVEKYVADRRLVTDTLTEEQRSEIDSDTGTRPSLSLFFQRPESFEYYREDGTRNGWFVANEWDTVPVFHFANNSDLGEYGASELHDAVPVQDALNKSVFDMLVAGEFQAYPQRYALNIDVKEDAQGNPISPFKAGPERVWALTGGENVSIGQFPPADQEKMLAVKRDWALDMAQVTGTPTHYFMATSNMVSGESQKTAEQKLDAKVRDRTTAFGEAWSAAIALAVRMERGEAVDGLELDCGWKDLKPRNEKEQWEIWKIKAELGLSFEQILREAGYSQEQIDAFKEEEGGALGAQEESPLERLLNGNRTPFTS